MKKDIFEEKVAHMLHESADSITGDAALDQRVQQQLAAVPCRKPMRARRITAIVAAAALCIAFTGALASGRVTTLMSAPPLSEKHTAVETLRQDAVAVAEQIALPEMLGEFAFRDGEIEQTRKIDADGEMLGAYPSVMAYYVRGDQMIWLSVHAWQADLDEEKTYVNLVETREIGGVTFALSDDPYLSVSEDYVLTGEQRAAMEAGTLMVSVRSGTGERCETNQFHHLEWTQDGVCYSIGGWDTALSADEMFAMAAQTAGVA